MKIELQISQIIQKKSVKEKEEWEREVKTKHK